MWAVKGSANEIWNVLFLDELTLPYFIPAEKRQIKPVELQQYFEVINTGTQNKAYQATINKKLNPLTYKNTRRITSRVGGESGQKSVSFGAVACIHKCAQTHTSYQTFRNSL